MGLFKEKRHVVRHGEELVNEATLFFLPSSVGLEKEGLQSDRMKLYSYTPQYGCADKFFNQRLLSSVYTTNLSSDENPLVFMNFGDFMNHGGLIAACLAIRTESKGRARMLGYSIIKNFVNFYDKHENQDRGTGVVFFNKKTGKMVLADNFTLEGDSLALTNKCQDFHEQLALRLKELEMQPHEVSGKSSFYVRTRLWKWGVIVCLLAFAALFLALDILFSSMGLGLPVTFILMAASVFFTLACVSLLLCKLWYSGETHYVGKVDADSSLRQQSADVLLPQEEATDDVLDAFSFFGQKPVELKNKDNLLVCYISLVYPEAKGRLPLILNAFGDFLRKGNRENSINDKQIKALFTFCQEHSIPWGKNSACSIESANEEDFIEWVKAMIAKQDNEKGKIFSNEDSSLASYLLQAFSSFVSFFSCPPHRDSSEECLSVSNANVGSGLM